MNPFPVEVLRWGPLAITDTVLVTLVLSALLVVGGRIALSTRRGRELLELSYESLERSILEMTPVDAQPLVPLILTLWLFIGIANLIGLVPGVSSPTRDLSLTAALAIVSFFGGHYHAFRQHRLAYLRQYLEPHPLLLPLNVVGEVSRTLALALRLFGNMLSGSLIGAILVYLAGLLVPVPMMLLSVLTSLVQAYIFGVLTLVFAASSLQAATPKAARKQAASKPSSTSSPAHSSSTVSSSGVSSSAVSGDNLRENS